MRASVVALPRVKAFTPAYMCWPGKGGEPLLPIVCTGEKAGVRRSRATSKAIAPLLGLLCAASSAASQDFCASDKEYWPKKGANCEYGIALNNMSGAYICVAGNVRTYLTPLDCWNSGGMYGSLMPAHSKSPLPEMAAPPSASGYSIRMKKDGGTYVVPVLINNAITLDFVVDSGAADVTIPEDVVMTLRRTGTIRDSDFIGERTYVLADGSRVKSHTFRIRSLKVGDRVLENVTGSVSSRQGSLLLGQSFLGRFKSWSVDNTKHALVLE
jgi:clan AA aspartic protease (TIGR02281 family)